MRPAPKGKTMNPWIGIVILVCWLLGILFFVHDKTEKRWAISLVVAVSLIAVGYHYHMTSKGYVLQWSSINWRYIWVDKNGQP